MVVVVSLNHILKIKKKRKKQTRSPCINHPSTTSNTTKKKEEMGNKNMIQGKGKHKRTKVSPKD